MRASKKAYAKVNLCLNVGARQESGFHPLESLVVTVDIFDKITLVSRKDEKVVLKVGGSNKDYLYNHTVEKDNAYRAARAYMQATGCLGVDIYLEKHLPLSSGMGGSSTCAAATLLCMEELYKKKADLNALANELGSDTAYLLKGGWAVLKGRGDVVEYLPIKKRLQMVAIFASGGVDTAECFKFFDEKFDSENADNSDIDALIRSLSSDEIAYSECKNDLEEVACAINPQVKKAIDFAKTLSPKAVFMTGSGSTVIMLFDYDGLNAWAVSKCKQAGFEAEVLNTVFPK